MANAKDVKELSVTEKLELVRLRKEELELIALEDQVKRIQARHAQEKMTAEQVEAAVAEESKNRTQLIQQCNHRKGGKGLEALLSGQGSDSNYSILRHTYAWGETVIHCLRCPGEWHPGDTKDSHASGFSYKEALLWPTDNEPSGTQLFMIYDPNKARKRAAAGH